MGWSRRSGSPGPPRASAPDGRFAPDRHGFGFRNWSTRTQYFEAPPGPERRTGPNSTGPGTYMDPTRGDYACVRSLFGATPGTYRIGVLGTEATEYDLTVLVAEPDDVLTNETHAGTLDAGEVHEFDLEVPDGAPAR